MPGTIEVNPGANPITGTITATVENPAGVAPTNIVRMNTPWQVKVDWTLDGSGLNMLAGSWNVTVVVEGIGNIFEGIVGTNNAIQIPEALVNGGTATATGLAYTCTIPVAANLVPDAGVYKLVTIITSLTAAGAPGSFAGFEEGPMVQFYP